MGTSNSKRSVKEEYLKLVERQKLIYAQKHPMINSAPRLLDWRIEVFQEVQIAARAVPWASWPAALQSLLEGWDILIDERWKSSLLWHDYLYACQLQRKAVGTTTRSTLAVPLPTESSSDTTNLIDFLRTHLEAEKTNAVSALIATFAREFSSFYALNPASELPYELAIDINDEQDLKKVTKEVHLFVSLCLDAFLVYYKGVDLTQLLGSLAEVKDLIMERIFSYPVAEVLIMVFRAADVEKQRQVDEKTAAYSHLTCSDLGVEPLFCLDRARTNGTRSHGYDKVITCLRSLPLARNPMAKLQVIVRSTRLVCECIDDYWEVDPSVDKDQLVVNADQILSIYFYAVLKARVQGLGAHLRLMLEFLRKDVKQSTMGYYLSTVEASLENVARLDEAFLTALKSHNV
jgi:hypothetical protein